MIGLLRSSSSDDIFSVHDRAYSVPFLGHVNYEREYEKMIVSNIVVFFVLLFVMQESSFNKDVS